MSTLALVLSLGSLVLTPAYATTCANPGAGQNLTSCSFANQDLGGLDLSNSILTGADLTGANLSGTTLDGVQSGNIIGTPSQLPEGWQLLYGYLIGPGANLNNVNFSGKDLTNANFVDSNLTNVNFAGATLTNADLDGADITGLVSGGIIGAPIHIPNPWKLYKGFLIGPTANLSSADLGNINLTSFDISQANLNAATFTGANFTDVDLTGTSLIDIALYDCNLTRTDFSGLDVEGIRATGVIGTPKGLPSNFKTLNGILIGPYANLSSLNLANINFIGTNLHYANLNAANLSGANLAGLDLTLTNFVGVNLTNANITNTNLTGVDIGGVISSGVIGTPIGLSNEWQLYQGYLLGPRANLNGVNFANKDLRGAKLKGVQFSTANLSGANISGMDFSNTNLSSALMVGTNITGTDLTGATLTNVHATDLIGTPTGLSSGWKVLNKYLVGPGANLNNADLSGLNLSSMDLSNTSLLVADFSSANLAGANLNNAAITDANFTNANLANVISSGLVGTPRGLPNSFQLLGGKIVGVFFNSPIPTITGKSQVGKTLTSVTGSWDPSVSLTYKWLRDGTPIDSATTLTYVLTPDDFDHDITFSVTGTATGGVTRTKSSTPVTITLGTLKPSTVKIVGKVIAGKTVSASVTNVVGVTTTYVWNLNGKPIKGATKASLKLAIKTKGQKLSVTITQTAVGYKPLSTSTKHVVVK